MRKLLIFLALLALPGLAPSSFADDDSKIAKSIHEFSFATLEKLSPTSGNLIFSPYSISTALQMTLPGAKGDTYAQISSALKIAHPELYLSHAHTLQDKIEDDTTVTLNVANSLWISDAYHIQTTYLDTVKRYFRSEVLRVNFSSEPDTQRNKINSWVSNKTREKIQNLLAPGTVQSSTRLILVNAIYFLGRWANEFNPENTRKGDFFITPNEKSKADFMSQTNSYPYFENEELQILELPYSGNQFAMNILLPRGELDSLVKKLTSEYFDSLTTQLKPRKVIAQIPRFKSETSFNLSQTLSSLGIKDAFQFGLADFSGISNNKELYISDVVHKAIIEVGEKGTEAAAATAIIMRAGSAFRPEEEKPILFRADRPFIYVLRHIPTGAVVFMGRLSRPS